MVNVIAVPQTVLLYFIQVHCLLMLSEPSYFDYNLILTVSMVHVPAVKSATVL